MGVSLSSAPALADIIHLKNGATLNVQEWWEGEGEVRYRRAGGVIGIPRDQIERIEPGAASASTEGGRAASSRDPAPARGSGRSGRGTAPPSVSIQPPGAGWIGVPPSRNDPAGWAARLEELEATFGKPGVEEAGARREAAVLHTLLGNEAAKSGDMDAAESHYRRAVDQDPDLPAPLLNLARLRITQSRHDDADRLIQDALALRPEEPTALALMADVAYSSDRIEEAIDLWERSLARRPDAGIEARLRKARRELEVVQDYYRTDATHFTLKYDGERASEALGREILDHLESTYADLSSRFNVYPPSTILVTLYAREAFHDVTGSPRWVGGLFDGQIRIPVGGLTQLTSSARGVLTHELAHAMVYVKTRGNCPKWIQEGIAQWAEGKSARSARRDLARRYGRATPAEVAGDFSYAMSVSLLEHFLDTYSLSHLLDLLEALGHGSDLEAAFVNATGDGYESFLGAWVQALAGPEARP